MSYPRTAIPGQPDTAIADAAFPDLHVNPPPKEPTTWRGRLTVVRGQGSVLTTLIGAWALSSALLVNATWAHARAWSLIPEDVKAHAAFWAPYDGGNIALGFGVVGICTAIMLGLRFRPLWLLAAGAVSTAALAAVLVTDLRGYYAIEGSQVTVQHAEPWLSPDRLDLATYRDRECWHRWVHHRRRGSRLENHFVYGLGYVDRGRPAIIDLAAGLRPGELGGFLDALVAGGALEAEWRSRDGQSARDLNIAGRFSAPHEACLAHFSAGLTPERAANLRALSTAR